MSISIFYCMVIVVGFGIAMSIATILNTVFTDWYHNYKRKQKMRRIIKFSKQIWSQVVESPEGKEAIDLWHELVNKYTPRNKDREYRSKPEDGEPDVNEDRGDLPKDDYIKARNNKITNDTLRWLNSR